MSDLPAPPVPSSAAQAKWICLSEQHADKSKSLEDNVYFTLREFFMHADTYDMCRSANYFNARLTGNICLEDRPPGFTYTNRLHDPEFVSKLDEWLFRVTPLWLDPVTDANFESGTAAGTLLPLEQWWNQFETMRDRVRERCKQLQIQQV